MTEISSTTETRAGRRGLGARRPGSDTRRRRQRCEAAILAGVEQLLADHRWSELTVDAVARAAGLSRTAFYRFFPDLGTVLVRLVANVSDEIAVSGAGFWQAPVGSLDGLHAAASGAAAVFRDHHLLLRAMADASSTDEALDRTYRALVGRFVTATETRIRSDQAARAVPSDLDPIETAWALVWGTERYLSKTYERRPMPDDATVIDTVVRMWSMCGWPNSPSTTTGHHQVR